MIAAIQKIDVSERIDTNKTNASRECMLFHYWYFKNVRYKLNHIFAINVMMY